LCFERGEWPGGDISWPSVMRTFFFIGRKTREGTSKVQRKKGGGKKWAGEISGRSPGPPFTPGRGGQVAEGIRGAAPATPVVDDCKGGGGRGGVQTRRSHVFSDANHCLSRGGKKKEKRECPERPVPSWRKKGNTTVIFPHSQGGGGGKKKKRVMTKLPAKGGGGPVSIGCRLERS